MMSCALGLHVLHHENVLSTPSDLLALLLSELRCCVLHSLEVNLHQALLVLLSSGRDTILLRSSKSVGVSETVARGLQG